MPVDQRNPNNFVSRHWLVAPQANGQELRVHTGVAIVDLKPPPGPLGFPIGTEFRDRVVLGVPIDAKPNGSVAFTASNWTVLIGVAAIIEVDISSETNLFAVDGFGFTSGASSAATFEMYADVVVRGFNSELFRLNYQLTLLGKWVKVPPLT